MKPDWKDAPEWANWLAMDRSGAWWWYENRPTYNERFSIWSERSGMAEEAVVNNSVCGTLEARP